ncbi:APG9-domain-containing protein [Thelephora ganbajun]|uniref:APG9-domain-containing protein n=1 Tax=Thelephora ganbajun TaxID=370292 RepID=A0ACB6ZPY9_THEGA|nr:APG9-domain-containing protein [Thelephora ganbajun]
MSSPPNSRKDSRSVFSLNASTSASRPFLNVLNPMARSRDYKGYIQANQSVLEEAEEDEADNASVFALQNSPRQSAQRDLTPQPTPPNSGWRGYDASATNVLRPNIQEEDHKHVRLDHSDSSDDEVPQSFMIEASSSKPRRKPSKTKEKAKAKELSQQPSRLPLLSKGDSTRPILPTTTQDLKAIYAAPPLKPPEIDPPGQFPHGYSSPPQPKQMRGLDAYERALWSWVNVYNLDAFLQEVYQYYQGKGIYCIALSRGLNLLTVGFVIGFSTFLLGCVEYSRIRPEHITRLSDVVVDQCVSKFSGFTLLFFLLFTAFYIWRILTFVFEVRRLMDMYQFYTHLLRIPDADIQTIAWPEVVRRIGAIREENPLTALSSHSTSDSTTATAKLDAHDIANRILRQENYLIALFNKELLDLRVPLPPVLQRFVPPEEGKGRMLTKALEWNLRFCLMEYLFDKNGRVRKVFLKSKNRPALVEGLRRRFVFMGILNAIFAPFIVLYLIMYSFFRYFDEYHKNPSSIGGRKYTPFAEWKFREFNELPHHFTRRLDESYPTASMYIGQFPNEKLTIIMRFFAFIAGSFAAVLLLATVIDPDLFVGFEVTSHRTVLFYVGVFGSILAVARGMIPEENRVFDPELLIMEVIQHTHYMPDDWKDQLHSKKVHQEFGELFAMKIMIYAQELLSVALTPFVLWFSLPDCAPAIVDFFREFTIHVDSLGYVCSFAVFDFQRHGNVKFGAPTEVNDERLMSKEGKMEKSFLNFKAVHPEWTPRDPTGSLYLSRMAAIHGQYRPLSPTSPFNRRRIPGMGTGVSGGVDLAERSREYDRALKASQMIRSRFQPPPARNPGDVQQSLMVGMDMAQTAILGDTGDTATLPSKDKGKPDLDPRPFEAKDKGKVAVEGGDRDDGVGEGVSGLGESYVDGAVKRPKLLGLSQTQQQEEDEELLADGGVLGLLAQIYGRKDRSGL